MIEGTYILELWCTNMSLCDHPGSPSSSAVFKAPNAQRARYDARQAGWAFKGGDALCPKCAGPHRHKPRYPGRTLA
jgi:hypothetical protein